MYNEQVIISECMMQRYLSHLKVESKPSNGVLIVSTITNYALDCLIHKKEPSLELFQQKFNIDWFEFKNHLIGTSQQWLPKIQRFYEYMHTYDVEPLTQKYTVQIGDADIEVKADFTYRDKDGIHICKIRSCRPDCTSNARKWENHANNNRRLNLLYLLGRKLYPNLPVIAEEHFLTAKNDKSSCLVEYYNVKSGENIVRISNASSTLLSMITSELNMLKEFSNVSQCSRNKTSGCAYECNHVSVCNYCYDKLVTRSIKVEKIANEEPQIKPKEISYTQEQLKIINALNGIYRVKAGAGTGKTQTIAERGAQLIKSGVKAKDILFITFTKKAAAEANSRICSRAVANGIPIEMLAGINCTTFNGWCQSILDGAYQILGFKSPPKVANRVEIFSILKSILDKRNVIEVFDYCNATLDFKNSKGVLFEIYKLIELFKVKRIESSQAIMAYLNSYDPEIQEHLAKDLEEIYREFNNELFNHNLIQYQDQLNLVTELINFFPNVIPKYAHIMVDEFQDCEHTQVDIIRFLSASAKSLMVVGDERQSIYGFRLTSPEFIIKFHELFPETIDLPLTHNFRSTKEIVAVGNDIASFSHQLVSNPLVPHRENGQLPVFKILNDQDATYDSILNGIKKDIAKGVPLNEICFLASTRAELEILRNILYASHIPNVLAVSEILYEKPELKMFICFGDYFLDQSYTEGLMQYLFLTDNKIFGLSNSQLEDYIQEKNLIFQTKINGLSEEERVDFFFKTMYACFKYDTALTAFMEEVRKNEFTKVSDILVYLNQFVTYKSDSFIESTENYNAVQLLTAHASKGKEYISTHVLINKFEENNRDVDETRRLLFVAATRAKDELTLYLNKAKADKCSLYVSELEEIAENKHLRLA